MVLTAFGDLMRDMRRSLDPPPPHHRPLTQPYRGRFVLGTALEVVEDGTPGTVWFKIENPDEGCGPAYLDRGDRSERLFRGHWVHRDMAEDYAREHGHDFGGDA